MPPVGSASGRRSAASTAPLGWDWPTELRALETAVEDVEAQVSWDWRREYARLERHLEELARRYGR